MRRDSSSPQRRVFLWQILTKAILHSQTIRASKQVPHSQQQWFRQHRPRVTSSNRYKQFSRVIHQARHLVQVQDQRHHLRYLKVG
jgi:uncharacterized protein YjcR